MEETKPWACVGVDGTCTGPRSNGRSIYLSFSRTDCLTTAMIHQLFHSQKLGSESFSFSCSLVIGKATVSRSSQAPVPMRVTSH